MVDLDVFSSGEILTEQILGMVLYVHVLLKLHTFRSLCRTLKLLVFSC